MGLNGSPLTLSVVISTYNRADTLADTLRSLEQQSYRWFEVVVVAGPCTDHTHEVLARYRGRIKVEACFETNLSKSRNLGVDASAGACVVFIDDDSIASPDWLAMLAQGYVGDVQGVGGFVLDHTGRRYQYEYSACHRYGETDFTVTPPLAQFVEPRAETFLYLQGTNASFRRDALVRIGGFNEQIAYFHDETDVCCRVIDQCGPLAMVPEAVVLHKYAPSHLRNVDRVVHDPYHVVRSQVIFTRQNGAGFYSEAVIAEKLDKVVALIRRGGEEHYRTGVFDRASRDRYQAQVDKGLADGAALAGDGRPLRHFRPADESTFLPFPVRETAGRLRACFVSQEYPPHGIGGIGRFTYDLATSFADHGHDVYVIAKSEVGADYTNYEDGVWVHRLTPREALPAVDPGAALIHNYELIVRVYRELQRLENLKPLDVVSAPLWNVEGALAMSDRRLPVVLTLMTSFKTVASFHDSWKDTLVARKMPLLEAWVLRSARSVQAISRSILDKVEGDYGPARGAQVVHLGVADQRVRAVRRRPVHDQRVRVLFVGRLERRKGIDVLLEAAHRLITAGLDVEFVLVGANTHNTELGGLTYADDFRRRHGDEPDLLRRVSFAGGVSEAELLQHYADADVFCLPSRFESFGLVLVEASVFGLPLIATRSGGAAEIVVEGETGLLVDADDCDGLTAALQKLVTSDDLRQTLGAAARRRYEQTFALDVTVPKTIEFYRAAARQRENIPPEQARLDVATALARMIKLSSDLDAPGSWALAEELLSEAAPSRPPIGVAVRIWAAKARKRLTRSFKKRWSKTFRR